MMIAVLAMALAPALLQAKDVFVRHDPGGLVEDYWRKYEDMIERGDRIVIDGWCASACTLALGVPGTCVTRRAVLVFHAAHSFFEPNQPTLVDLFMQTYPPKLRKWIMARGGLKLGRGMKIKGKELAQLIPVCNKYEN